LKGDAASLAFLNLPAAQTGAPAHLLTVYRTKAQGFPPTRAAFAAELARKGFDQAPAIYQDLQKRKPTFALSDAELTAWGYKLLRDGEVRSSVAIFELNAKLHADSWNAFDSLGEAYAKDGNRALATEAYRKSLALNPSNGNAVDQLSKLGVKP
jgi:Flp pilus assembly protein TadD